MFMCAVFLHENCLYVSCFASVCASKTKRWCISNHRILYNLMNFAVTALLKLN